VPEQRKNDEIASDDPLYYATPKPDVDNPLRYDKPISPFGPGDNYDYYLNLDQQPERGSTMQAKFVMRKQGIASLIKFGCTDAANVIASAAIKPPSVLKFNLKKETLDTINKVNGDRKITSLRKKLTMFRKNDPGYAITRSNAMFAINNLMMLVGRALDKGKKPTDAELSTWVDEQIEKNQLFTEFTGDLLAYTKAVVAAIPDPAQASATAGLKPGSKVKVDTAKAKAQLPAPQFKLLQQELKVGGGSLEVVDVDGDYVEVIAFDNPARKLMGTIRIPAALLKAA